MTTIKLDLRTARLIRQAFLPANPRKLRTATPEVRLAAMDFIALLEAAEIEQRHFEMSRGDEHHSPF
jgi:hypothetical protein